MSSERDKVAERAKIEEALKNSDYNIEEAAKELGASRRTLQNRMREYGMQRGTSGRRKARLPYGFVKKAARKLKSPSATGLISAAVAVGAGALVYNKFKRKPS